MALEDDDESDDWDDDISGLDDELEPRTSTARQSPSPRAPGTVSRLRDKLERKLSVRRSSPQVNPYIYKNVTFVVILRSGAARREAGRSGGRCAGEEGRSTDRNQPGRLRRLAHRHLRPGRRWRASQEVAQNRTFAVHDIVNKLQYIFSVVLAVVWALVALTCPATLTTPVLGLLRRKVRTRTLHVVSVVLVFALFIYTY